MKPGLWTFIRTTCTHRIFYHFIYTALLLHKPDSKNQSRETNQKCSNKCADRFDRNGKLSQRFCTSRLFQGFRRCTTTRQQRKNSCIETRTPANTITPLSETYLMAACTDLSWKQRLRWMEESWEPSTLPTTEILPSHSHRMGSALLAVAQARVGLWCFSISTYHQKKGSIPKRYCRWDSSQALKSQRILILFIYPLVEELLQLTIGVRTRDADLESFFTLRAHLLYVSGDIRLLYQ